MKTVRACWGGGEEGREPRGGKKGGRGRSRLINYEPGLFPRPLWTNLNRIRIRTDQGDWRKLSK